MICYHTILTFNKNKLKKKKKNNCATLHVALARAFIITSFIIITKQTTNSIKIQILLSSQCATTKHQKMKKKKLKQSKLINFEWSYILVSKLC